MLWKTASRSHFFNKACEKAGKLRRLFGTSSIICSQSKKNTLSVAIVGSGPSGFYSAKYLQLALQRAKNESAYSKVGEMDVTTTTEQRNDNAIKKTNLIESIEELNIDLIERLPTPFGLVRSGVAPDHPEVKNVENDFVALVENANNDQDVNDEMPKLKSSIEFRGNVEVGTDISLQELRDLYDVVILAYGCDSDKKLGIEIEKVNDGERFEGIYSAREFVAWYNGHPDYAYM